MTRPAFGGLPEWLNRPGRRHCRRTWTGAALAAIVIFGVTPKAPAGTVVRAGNVAAVKTDAAYVYVKMDSTSYVVTILKRGEQVLVDRIRTNKEASWCSVAELSQTVRLGYVRCDQLERMEAHGPPPAAKPTSEPSAKRYALLVASLADQGNALSVKRRLEDLGYTPVIHITTARIERHRVYGGEFGGREEAERTARRLNVDGFASNLVETPDKSYRLEVGWFLDVKEANQLAAALKAKRYDARIISTTDPTPVHQVLIDGYADRAEALKVLHVLEKEGLAPRIVSQ